MGLHLQSTLNRCDLQGVHETIANVHHDAEYRRRAYNSRGSVPVNHTLSPTSVRGQGEHRGGEGDSAGARVGIDMPHTYIDAGSYAIGVILYLTDVSYSCLTN